MNNETMTDGDPMEAITAKKQADAERAEMNRQAEEAAENARIWPTPPSQCPVVPLGWNGDRMCFWSHAYRKIIQLRELKWTHGGLVRLAPLDDFAAWLGMEREAEKELISTAARRLEEECAPLTYREENILGRGVWYADRDKKEIIYSAGRRCYMLTASGEFKELNTCVWRGKIYTSDKKNTLPADTPLTDEEGQKLIDLLNLRPWKSYRPGEMLAGWMVCAMLSGLLTVRPQIWINAPACSGKSRLRDEDIAAAFGGLDSGYVCSVDGGQTTEAGLRRTLDREAVPVLFDELEPNEDKRRKQNIGNILDLIRTVATTKDPTMTQAAQNGGIVSFRPRFCSVLFSVNNALEKDTDVSRFFILRMNGKVKRAEKDLIYAKQEPLRALIQQKDFAPRLLRRVLEGARDVIRNAGTLADAMKKTLSAAGCRTADRSADMLAHIMAGAYALTHRGAISQEAIDDYAAAAVRIDEDRNGEIERMSETELALNLLLTHTIQLQGKGVTVERLCRIVEEETDAEKRALAKSALETCGLRWRHDQKGNPWLSVHASYSGLQKIFANSPIPKNKVRSILKNDDDGIGICEGQTRFAAISKGPISNALHIPGEYVLNRTEE